VQGIDEVEEMLSSNIVQGKLNQQGNYGERNSCFIEGPRPTRSHHGDYVIWQR
jgi:hypothetical protein